MEVAIEVDRGPEENNRAYGKHRHAGWEEERLGGTWVTPGFQNGFIQSSKSHTLELILTLSASHLTSPPPPFLLSTLPLPSLPQACVIFTLVTTTVWSPASLPPARLISLEALLRIPQ